MNFVYQEESSIRANRLKEEAQTLRRIGAIVGVLLSALVVCVFGVDADVLEEILGGLSMNVFAAAVLVLTCRSIGYAASVFRNNSNNNNRNWNWNRSDYTNSNEFNYNYNESYNSTRTSTRTRRSLEPPGTPASILRRRVRVPSTPLPMQSPLVGIVTPRKSSLLVGASPHRLNLNLKSKLNSKTGRKYQSSPIPNSVSVSYHQNQQRASSPLVGGPFRR